MYLTTDIAEPPQTDETTVHYSKKPCLHTRKLICAQCDNVSPNLCCIVASAGSGGFVLVGAIVGGVLSFLFLMVITVVIIVVIIVIVLKYV